MNLKRCCTCKLEKDNSCFYVSKNRVQNDCKECRKASVKAYKKTEAGRASTKAFNDSEKAKNYRKKYNDEYRSRPENIAKATVYRKEYWVQFKGSGKYKKQVEERRNSPQWKISRLGYHLKARYRLSLDDYNGILRSQDDSCAICGRKSSGLGDLGVDHDHLTGIIRGLLCSKCNTAVGLLGDDPARIRRAAKYLETIEERMVKSG